MKGTEYVPSTSRTASPKPGAEVLLDAAEKLFLERGYANVSMQQIAESAGFTKGATYYHFESKEDLFLAVSRRIAIQLRDRLLAPFEGPGTFEEQLRNSIRTVQETFRGDMQRWWSDAAVVLPEEVKEHFLQDTFGISDPSLLLVPVFERAAAEGIVRNVSPVAASRIYSGLVTAGLEMDKPHRVPVDAEDLNQYIDDLVTIFLYGVQGTPPPAGEPER